MNNHKYILEPYNGMRSRYHCPACKHRKKTFSRYIDTDTGVYLSPDVGRCNRENKCGYHYTPKEYFRDNPIEKNKVRTVRTKARTHKNAKTLVNSTFDRFSSTRVRTGTESAQGTNSTASTHGTQGTHSYAEIPKDVFKKSLAGYEKNTFVDYLKQLFGAENTNMLIDKYKIGTSKKWKGATVFYQIDINNKVRAGKIMQYGENGRRIKEPYNKITWLHKVIKIDNYELRQCFFGEHLIQANDSPIAIVESEKTACIASIYLPGLIWLACGQLNGLNTEKCQVLEGRIVFLFPDLNGFDKWQKKAIKLQKELSGTRFIISDYLQRYAPDNDKGLDLADYLIRFDLSEFLELDKPRWFVISEGILKEYEDGNISDSQYLDTLQKNFENSSPSMDDYIRKNNGGLAWESEVKSVIKKHQNRLLDYEMYTNKIANICVKYNLGAESVVNFVNNLLA